MAAPTITVPAPRQHARLPALSVVLLGHVTAALCLLLGHPGLALAGLLPAAALLVWGSLWPHSRLFGPVLSRLPVSEPVVWLTIDDGPDDDTDAVLDVLDRHGAGATFFLIGTRAAAQPAHVRAIVERGHHVGNHSDTHPAARFWSLGAGAFEREVAGAQAVLTARSGQAPQWFRAVAGLTNPLLAPVLRRHGLSRAAWSGRGFDTVDADDARVLRRLSRAVCPGAILMLHQGLAPGRLPRLLDALLGELAARGYRTVLPVPAVAGSAITSQLLNGVLPQSGEKRADSPNAAS